MEKHIHYQKVQNKLRLSEKKRDINIKMNENAKVQLKTFKFRV